MVSHAFRLSLCLVTISCAATKREVRADDPVIHAFDVNIERVSSGREYTLGKAAIGELPYIDRKYAFKKLPPALTGQVALRTSMDDDYVDATDHLQFTLSAPATVYVGIDRRGRGVPDWLKSWTPSDESLSVDDIASRLYHRRFPAGRVTLGGNHRKQTGANNNYVVIIVPDNQAPAFAEADFAGKVLPLLSARCFACHGPDSQEGGLRLDVRRRAMLGGDTALAIVPGDSHQSEVIKRTVSADETQRMPQREGPLSAEEIDLLRRWIDAGAIWPEELAGREEFADHWSFRTIARPAVPSAKRERWIRTPIDAFILSKLEDSDLEPSPEADRRTLIRRLSLDLIGLPPTPDEVQAYLDDRRPDAYEHLVERLLDSPHFGERWGKHWLDLARFAESDGYENDRARPQAWRYRDWVINAINRDMPFDQFTIKQLAGDLIENSQPDDRIATGFHRNTLHNSAGGADQEEFRTKNVKDRTAVTGAVWMGLTLNCAECHTHKYDPISHREYYRLYAIFNNADHGQEGEAATMVAASRVTQIHKRGNFLDLGLEVSPGIPAFLPEIKPRGPIADRLDLARWLISPEHPLTARVAVNHVWQHLFGQGFVATPENFGRKGEPPSHPELLDWLAAEFLGLPAEQGTEPHITPWSRKSLVRLIVSSSVYRQASDHPATPPAADPDNRWLWRQNRFRQEAEIVRDIALAASGLLERTVGGPSVQPPLPKGLSELGELKNEQFQEVRGSAHRRGLYVHMQRTFPYPMFATFDSPDGNQCVMFRDRSTTPLQALTLLNDPALDECARAFGKRLMEATQDELGRVRFGFKLCLSRSPDDQELEVMRELVETQRKAGAADAAIWQGVARAILNLDEMITRE